MPAKPKPGNVIDLRPDGPAGDLVEQIVKRETDLGAWLAEGRELAERDARLTWEIGDWWNRGEPYGDRAKEGAALFHFNPSYLRHLGSVAARVLDRSNTLTWTHHEAVAHLDPPEQKLFLETAEKDNLSVRDMKRHIKRYGEDKQSAAEWKADHGKAEKGEREKHKVVKGLIGSIGLEGGWHEGDQWYLIFAPPLWAGCGDPTAFLTSPRAKAVKEIAENAARLSGAEFAALLRRCADDLDPPAT